MVASFLQNHLEEIVPGELRFLCTVWTVDFETPACKLYLLLISADAAQEKETKRRKCCCPLVFQSLQPMQ
jgi:hypothetical protein